MADSGIPAPKQNYQLPETIGGMTPKELVEFMRQALSGDPSMLPSGMSLRNLDVSGGTITSGGTTVVDVTGTVTTTDGLAPGTSPLPTVLAGLGTLHVFWTGLTNADA